MSDVIFGQGAGRLFQEQCFQNVVIAERNYAKSRYDYILETLHLKQSAGTLSEEDVANINGWLN